MKTESSNVRIDRVAVWYNMLPDNKRNDPSELLFYFSDGSCVSIPYDSMPDSYRDHLLGRTEVNPYPLIPGLSL